MNNGQYSWANHVVARYDNPNGFAAAGVNYIDRANDRAAARAGLQPKSPVGGATSLCLAQARPPAGDGPPDVSP